MSNHVQNPPSATVYVRNLPYEVSEEEVIKHFEPAGVPTRIAFSKDRETGRFKGIAFVTFPSVDIAESAVRNLNQVPLKGREIYLDFSRDRADWTQRGGDRGGGGERRGGSVKERPSRDYSDLQVPQQPPIDVPQDMHYGMPQPQPAQFMQQPQAQGQQFVQLSAGGLAMPQGQPGGGVVFAPPPQNIPTQPGQVVQMPTLIVQSDGRQVLLAAGQPLPAGNVQTLGTLPQGFQAVGSAPGGGTLLQGPGQGMHPGLVTAVPQPLAEPTGVVMPQLSGAPLLPGMGRVAPEPQKVKAPSELQHDMPIGQATAMHAGQQMANALGDPQSASAPSSQQTSNTVAGMSPKQLYQILKDLKAHIQANPEKSRATLKENLVLTKALFQAQILLGMHNPNAQIDGGSEGPLEPQGISAPANGGMTSDAAAEASVLSGAPSAVPSNQQEVLRKVMALTPEAIAQLDPQSRQHVEQIKEHIRLNNLQL